MAPLPSAAEKGADDAEEDYQQRHEADVDHLQLEAEVLDVCVQFLADVLELLLGLRLFAAGLADGVFELARDELAVLAVLALEKVVAG